MNTTASRITRAFLQAENSRLASMFLSYCRRCVQVFAVVISFSWENPSLLWVLQQLHCMRLHWWGRTRRSWTGWGWTGWGWTGWSYTRVKLSWMELEWRKLYQMELSWMPLPLFSFNNSFSGCLPYKPLHKDSKGTLMAHSSRKERPI